MMRAVAFAVFILVGITSANGQDGAMVEGTWVSGDGDGLIELTIVGQELQGTIAIVDENTLKLRGFIGVSLFGRTETWRRRSD